MNNQCQKQVAIIVPRKNGGVFINSLNLASILQKLDYEPYLILTNDTDKQEWSLPNDIKIPFTHFNFRYSSLDNKYYTCRKLRSFVTANTSLIILNDWLEYKMISAFPPSAKTVAVLHGDYDFYYRLAFEHQKNIDIFIAVSTSIKIRLCKLLPEREGDIFYMPPVFFHKELKKQEHSANHLRIIFVGRLTEEKGFPFLIEADSKLKAKDIQCKWTIIAPHTTDAYDQWLSSDNVFYSSFVSHDEMQNFYVDNDVFLLPSKVEGFPLSLIEAGSCKLVPIVTNLEGGATELVTDGENGFLINYGDVDSIVACISSLADDSKLLKQMQEKTLQKIKGKFSLQHYLQTVTQVLEHNSGTKKSRTGEFKGDRLDKKWIPNFITKTIRKTF